MRIGPTLKPRLSYANVMATIAVFGVLGGGAYATHTHRMGTQDLQNRAVTAPKLANNAVVPRAIRQNAVRPAKIQARAVRRGKIANAAVTSRAIGPVSFVEERVSVQPGAGGGISVTCPDDEIAIAGGGDWPGLNQNTNDDVTLTHVRPRIEDGRSIGWTALGRNNKEFARDLRAVALCLRP